MVQHIGIRFKLSFSTFFPVINWSSTLRFRSRLCSLRVHLSVAYLFLSLRWNIESGITDLGTTGSELVGLGESWGWLEEWIGELKTRIGTDSESDLEAILCMKQTNFEKIDSRLQMAPLEDKVEEKMTDFHEC